MVHTAINCELMRWLPFPCRTVFREAPSAGTEACSSRGAWQRAWPHLGAEADVWQEEVNRVKHPASAVPDAVEAHPAHSDISICAAGRGTPLLSRLQYKGAKLMQASSKDDRILHRTPAEPRCSHVRWRFPL